MNASLLVSGFSEAEYQLFVNLVRAESGLEIPASRRMVLEKAVRESMAELRLASPGELLHRLNDGTGHRGTVEALVARLTIGETHFFRNQPQFEALRTLVLPNIIKTRRAEKRLRVWSAGCATGEEPYSLAIMIERLLPDIAEWDVRIFATDINRDSLESLELQGRALVLRGSTVARVESDGGRPRVHFEARGPDPETFDHVVLALGGTTPENFLKTIGIDFDGAAPVLKEGYETSLPGLFLVGDLTAGRTGGSIVSAFNSANEAMRALCEGHLDCPLPPRPPGER